MVFSLFSLNIGKRMSYRAYVTSALRVATVGNK
jgi:hypothetical protein